jgi:hypothetical protein
MRYAYLICVLWTAAALAYRNDCASISLTTLAALHWGLVIAYIGANAMAAATKEKESEA